MYFSEALFSPPSRKAKIIDTKYLFKSHLKCKECKKQLLLLCLAIVAVNITTRFETLNPLLSKAKFEKLKKLNFEHIYSK